MALLHGRKVGRIPCFSGLISITQPGLKAAGLHMHDIHHDAKKIAMAAASSYRLSGFGSAVAPFDMCVEAEALGAEVDFGENAERPELPRARRAPYQSIAEIPPQPPRPGRLPIICDAIRLLKADLGQEIAIGAYVPGPFTLSFFLADAGNLFEAFKRTPDELHRVLDRFSGIIAQSARAYRDAGADFVTVHEMGGAPSVLGPARFEAFVLPALKSLVAAIPRPRVLAVCGKVDGLLPAITATEADAYSLDQTSDLASARAALGPERLLFGNVDPVGALANGSTDDVRRAAKHCVDAGVDAVWPGCDLWPLVPKENLIAMVEAVENNKSA